MIHNTVRSIKAGAESKLLDANDLYWSIFAKGAPGMVLSILLMWGLNVAGWQEVNYIFFFIGMLFFLYVGFSPKAVLTALGVGVVVQGLQDEDLTKGAVVVGLKALYQVVLGVMLWFGIIVGILSVVSFEPKPLAFLPIAATLLIMTLTFASVKSRVLKGVVTVIGTLVIGYHSWYLVPEEWKLRASGKVAARQQVPPKPTMFSAMLSTEEWRTIELPGGKCIWYRTEDPKKDDLLVEVSGMNLNWVERTEYRRLKALGKAPFKNPAWMQFLAKEPGVKLTWEFRTIGQCD
jgi:hypothetical protein